MDAEQRSSGNVVGFKSNDTKVKDSCEGKLLHVRGSTEQGQRYLPFERVKVEVQTWKSMDNGVRR